MAIWPYNICGIAIGLRQQNPQYVTTYRVTDRECWNVSCIWLFLYVLFCCRHKRIIHWTMWANAAEVNICRIKTYGQSIPSGFLLTRVNRNICICFTCLVWWCTDGYLADHLILASDAAPRCHRLRSANRNRLTACASLSTQHVRYGCRAFHYAGPTVWNSLWDERRKADSFDSFKTVLENVYLIR